jgi:hypothetical protein
MGITRGLQVWPETGSKELIKVLERVRLLLTSLAMLKCRQNAYGSLNQAWDLSHALAAALFSAAALSEAGHWLKFYRIYRVGPVLWSPRVGRLCGLPTSGCVSSFKIYDRINNVPACFSWSFLLYLYNSVAVFYLNGVVWGIYQSAS